MMGICPRFFYYKMGNQLMPFFTPKRYKQVDNRSKKRGLNRAFLLS
jgi:hypothetical protein